MHSKAVTRSTRHEAGEPHPSLSLPRRGVGGEVVLLLISCLMILCSSAAHAKKSFLQPTERAVYHNNQGILFLNQNSLERAFTEFKTAVELSPTYVEALNNVGIVLKLQGKLDEAANYFREAINLDKNYASAYVHLGTVYLAKGDPENAEQTIRKGLKRDGTLADGFYNLGLAYLELSKIKDKNKFEKKAEDALKKATEINPNLKHVHEILAKLYNSQSRYELASIRYRLALGDDPQGVKNWLELGEMKLNQHDIIGAQGCFQKAIELNPYSAEAHIKLGDLFAASDKMSDAINEYKGVTLFDPQNDTAWFKLGSAYLEDNELQKAIDPLKQAKKLNPSHSDASYNLGLVYLGQGKTREAANEWEYATVVNPKHASALYNLGGVYHELGETKKSINAYCKFVEAAQEKFPNEVATAKKIIEESKLGCSN